MPISKLLNRKVITWALYDWANSAFALSVLAVLFPLVLGSLWGGDDGTAQSTVRLSGVTFVASVIVFVSAPVLGTIADAGGYRKRFLAVFAVVGSLTTTALAFVGPGQWQLALFLYLIASVGYYSSIIFYDSLLIDVTEPRNYSFVSTFGFAIGYLGSAALLGLHFWMLKSPQTFGLDSTTEAFSAAFITVGVWWFVFLLPLLRVVPERHSNSEVSKGAIKAAYKELRTTIIAISRYRNVVIFLVGYWLYVGGVFTVIFMAANYGQRLGFDPVDILTALLVSNIVGFPATLIYAAVAHRIGARPCIYFALLIYSGACLWSTQMATIAEFFTMAILIGVVQGGVQGLSRSVYASLIPPRQPGEFFGFYSMTTKLAHVLGPALVAIASLLSDDPKWVLLSLMPLFLCGGLILALVKIPQSVSGAAAS